MKVFDNTIHHKYSFDTLVYDFAGLFSEKLHISKDILPYCHKIKEQDQSFAKNLYSLFDDKDIDILYRTFIRQTIKKYFGYTRVVYQKIPNIKIYYAGFHSFDCCSNKGIKQNDSDTITIILPLTNMYDTNTIWLETNQNSGLLKPVNIAYGEYLAFCQQNLIRDFRRNDTGHSSVFLEFMFTSYDSYKNTINSLILDSTASIL